VTVLVNNFFIFLRFEEFSGGLEGSLIACTSILQLGIASIEIFFSNCQHIYRINVVITKTCVRIQIGFSMEKMPGPGFSASGSETGLYFSGLPSIHSYLIMIMVPTSGKFV
jgi:hypothetical protein